MKRRPKKAKKSRESISSLKKALDAHFSRFIRIRDGGRCFTCGIQKHWKEMQNGHFITRGKNSLRYDERNCNCQCVGCNVFKGGNYPAYALALTEKYGADIIKTLVREGNTIKQFTVPELKALIEKYEAL